MVVSNPPYVTYAEKRLMRKNVTDFEPHLALFVNDNDALLFYRHIIRFCVKYLKKGGSCYFEINEQFAQAIENLFIANGFTQVKTYKDIFGKDRFVKGVL
jgi:release factor glutamine methyltransferase